VTLPPYISVYRTQADDASHVTLTGISGAIQMDFNADRISDFMMYYLSSRGVFSPLMHIPLSHASRNITDCMPWMVRCF